MEKAKVKRQNSEYRTSVIGNSKTAALAEAEIDIRRANEAEKLNSIDEGVFNDLLEASKKTGIPKSDFAKLARMEPEKQKAAAGKIKSGEAAGVDEAVKQEKRAERQRLIEAQAARQAAAPPGRYGRVVIDPPWNYGTGYDPGGRRAANPYPEMAFDEIAALDVKTEPDAVAFLWATHRFIWDAKKLLEKWGFECRSLLVWDKEKMGMGDLFRLQCEFCLVGVKGRPLLDNPRNLRDIIREPRREHSRKPETFYGMVEALCRGLAKIEYFAREKREGWAAYGNDTCKFVGR